MAEAVVFCEMGLRYMGEDNLPQIKEKAAEIKNLKIGSAYASEVKGLIGVYDMLVRLKADKKDDILGFTEKLRHVEGVRSAVTLYMQ